MQMNHLESCRLSIIWNHFQLKYLPINSIRIREVVMEKYNFMLELFLILSNCKLRFAQQSIIWERSKQWLLCYSLVIILVGSEHRLRDIYCEVVFGCGPSSVFGNLHLKKNCKHLFEHKFRNLRKIHAVGDQDKG